MWTLRILTCVSAAILLDSIEPSWQPEMRVKFPSKTISQLRDFMREQKFNRPTIAWTAKRNAHNQPCANTTYRWITRGGDRASKRQQSALSNLSIWGAYLNIRGYLVLLDLSFVFAMLLVWSDSCNWLALRCMVLWMNYLLPEYESIFWKLSFIRQLVCMFDIAENDFCNVCLGLYIYVYAHLNNTSWWMNTKHSPNLISTSPIASLFDQLHASLYEGHLFHLPKDNQILTLAKSVSSESSSQHCSRISWELWSILIQVMVLTPFTNTS